MTASDADGEIAAAAHLRLLSRGETVCCAESLTGGRLADLLSGTPGASATFRGGIVSYATEVKRSVLGVTASQVVSADCAAQMATGARELLGADWALATTGVAGPERQDDRPVGTVYIALAGPAGVHAQRLALAGDRDEIRRQAARSAIEVLADELG